MQRANVVKNWNRNLNIAIGHEVYFADVSTGAAAPGAALTPQKRGPWRLHLMRRQGRWPLWTAAADSGRPLNTTVTVAHLAPRSACAMARPRGKEPLAWSRLRPAPILVFQELVYFVFDMAVSRRELRRRRSGGEVDLKGVIVLFTPLHALLEGRGNGKGDMAGKWTRTMRMMTDIALITVTRNIITISAAASITDITIEV